MNEIMKKIIGGFGGGVYEVSPKMAMQRHLGRMIMLVRWTFLDYCERHHCGELSLAGFGCGLQHADIGMWMDEPYMQMYKTGGDGTVLAQYSLDTLKALYHYIKGLN